MVGHILQTLQHILQDLYGAHDHFVNIRRCKVIFFKRKVNTIAKVFSNHNENVHTTSRYFPI